MKVLKQYQCEICKRTYANRKNAIECESKGKPNIDRFPRFVIYQYKPDDFYAGMTFCFADWAKYNTHYVVSNDWGCRNNGAGDNLK